MAKRKEKAPPSIEVLMTTRHSKNINDLHDENLTLGDKMADAMANFAGSWTFILLFTGALVLWITLNTVQLFFRSFDPFPYILLNLVLSCVAALQAPVIMMSQNRQEKKDRLRGEMDYQINLKSEVLIEEILKRLDRLEQQNQSLADALRQDRG